MEEIQIWQLYTAAAVVAVAVVTLISITLHSERNTLEWWHFISTRGRDGKQYADLTKLGQLTGILLCIASVFIFAARKSTTATEFSVLLGVVLLYLGGVQAYQTVIKSKRADAAPPTEEKEQA